MRLSTGKCYEISGTMLQRVPVGPLDTLATWRDRREDLWAESSVIAHVHHTWTAEENGLWNAMSRELHAVNERISQLERDAHDE